MIKNSNMLELPRNFSNRICGVSQDSTKTIDIRKILKFELHLKTVQWRRLYTLTYSHIQCKMYKIQTKDDKGEIDRTFKIYVLRNDRHLNIELIHKAYREFNTTSNIISI